MTATTFWCDYELERFPIDQLAKDERGSPVHHTSSGPCHHPNGTLCIEVSAPRVLTHWNWLEPEERARLLQSLTSDSFEERG